MRIILEVFAVLAVAFVSRRFWSGSIEQDMMRTPKQCRSGLVLVGLYLYRRQDGETDWMVDDIGRDFGLALDAIDDSIRLGSP